MLLTVNVTGTEAVRRMLKQIGAQASGIALAATAEQVEDYIEGEAAKHNKTGVLVRSIYKRKIAGGWEIGHDPQVAKHALFVHWGTKPHVIRPKNKKALRWGGRVFTFAKKVKHPGYKGDPWLVRAAALAPAIFEQQLAARITDAQNKA